ncbi:trypsin-like [Cydia pomonella]|uniref:trypsin-like n=1 Tax=Cydia pomonella TaxID=82600 RepID=UPI002ADE898A|nr:trypsin-like [Cydia pomonella]
MMAVGLLILILNFQLVKGKLEGFIVGGSVVESIKKFPHVAFLNLEVPDSKLEFICGSSILNQLILLTAAHCLDGITKGTVSVGNVYRENGTLYRIASFRLHEQWNSDDLVNNSDDIALCKVKKPLILGSNVKRVVLMKDPPKAGTADLAGWGATDEKFYTESIQLKHTKQKLWTHQQCRKILRQLPRGAICGGESRARENFASKGDSGSGLLIDNQIIVGLVSYKDVHVSRSLMICTDVPYYYDWIVRTSQRLTCSFY